MISPGQGILLIANPFLKDPNFIRSVIFLCEHQEDGTFGFVLNKKFSKTIFLYPCSENLFCCILKRFASMLKMYTTIPSFIYNLTQKQRNTNFIELTPHKKESYFHHLLVNLPCPPAVTDKQCEKATVNILKEQREYISSNTFSFIKVVFI